jgi:dTDP-glucose 4,6-dehydratase
MTIEQTRPELIRRSPVPTARSRFTELPEDDPRVRKPDITRARTLLGWEPKVPLDEGLVKTLEYFRTKVTV